MKLLGRILVDKRVAVLPIALAIIGNVLVYALLLYPLQTRVANAEARKAAAERDRAAAARELQATRAIQTGKQRAETDLRDFYKQVLPTDMASARKTVFLRLAQLARESNLKLQREVADERKDEKTSDLTRLHMTVVLDGSYDNVRRFMHAVQTAGDFIIIDNMALAMRNEGNAPLELTVSVSTYFRGAGHVA